MERCSHFSHIFKSANQNKPFQRSSLTSRLKPVRTDVPLFPNPVSVLEWDFDCCHSSLYFHSGDPWPENGSRRPSSPQADAQFSAPEKSRAPSSPPSTFILKKTPISPTSSPAFSSSPLTASFGSLTPPLALRPRWPFLLLPLTASSPSRSPSSLCSPPQGFASRSPRPRTAKWMPVDQIWP